MTNGNVLYAEGKGACGLEKKAKIIYIFFVRRVIEEVGY